MADSPDRPANDGVVRMPSIDGGMNKLPPGASGGGKGSKDDDKFTRLGRDKSKDEELLQRARKRFDRASQAESDNRRDGLEDDKFVAGEQWPVGIAALRQFEQRPCLTFNRFPTLIHQVTNDQRMNRPAINISPVGDRGDPEAAKVYANLIRAIERDSEADIAYDTAFESAVRKGWGYWRIITDWESPESFDQSIRIRRIPNANSVYLDPNHTEPDGADATYAFISEMMTRDEFKEAYPDANQMSWTQAGVGDSFKNWVEKDSIRVADYFEIENEKRDLVMLGNGHVGWKDEVDPAAIEAFGIYDERESDWPTVHWYKLTAVEVLQDEPWLGKWIPIVKVIGDEINIDGKTKLWGIVRNAKDAQRNYNYWRTAETELVALAPKAPFIMEEGQIEGHEQQWKQANVKSFPYLLYKKTDLNGTPAPPPQRQPPVQIPAGAVNAADRAAQDMSAISGIRFDGTVKDKVYDESGRALRELRRFGDIASFHYVDNLARSLRHTGEMLIDLMPKIYNRKRVMTMLREDDTEERVQIDPNAPKPFEEKRLEGPNAKLMKIFNPTMGRYGVTVTIGPSYATKRIEAAESMMDFIRAIPTVAPAVADLVANEMDWPGGHQFATRLAKVVAQQFPGTLTPDMKDVPPQVVAQLQAMDAQVKQLMQEKVLLQKALTDQQADRAQRQDEIEMTFEAKLLKIVADMEKAQEANAVKAADSFNRTVGSSLERWAESVAELRDALANPTPKKEAAD
jgi:hypothetical protein